MAGLAGGHRKKLIAWVRWITEADGIGPGYCEHCKSDRNESTPCDDCPEPQLLPENIEAVRLFDALATQWRRDRLGRPVALEYPAAESAMRLMKLRGRRRLFEKLRVMEAAVIAVALEQSKNDDTH